MKLSSKRMSVLLGLLVFLFAFGAPHAAHADLFEFARDTPVTSAASDRAGDEERRVIDGSTQDLFSRSWSHLDSCTWRDHGCSYSTLGRRCRYLATCLTERKSVCHVGVVYLSTPAKVG